MASYHDHEDEEQLNGEAVQSGESGVVNAGAGGVGSIKAEQDNPGNFVKLQTYLDANKAQAGKLGDQVSGKITGSINDAQSEINSVGGKFNSLADQGTIKNLSNATNDYQNIVNTAATGSYGNNLNQQNTDRFKEISNAEYKGPQDFTGTNEYQAAQKKIGSAEQNANLSKTESGRQELLRNLYANPSYTTGENKFDSILLGGKENAQKLADSRAQVPNLQNSLTQTHDQSKQYAQNLAKQSQDVKDASRAYVQANQGTRLADVNRDLANTQGNWADEYRQYASLLNNSDQGNNLQLDQNQMQRLGVNQDQHLYNMLDGQNADQYLKLQAFDPNKVITKDQQAQLDALDRLANQYGGASTNKYTMADLAGTLNNKDAFDASGFGSAAHEQQGLFDNYAQNATASGTAYQTAPGGGEMPAWGGPVTASQTLENYLKGVGPNLTSSGFGPEATQNQRATDRYFQMIQDFLNQSGYAKKVKGK